MPSDYLGFTMEPTILGWQPGNGEWVLFHLADKAKEVALVEAGAHTAKDTSLVGIFRKQEMPPVIEGVRNGKPFKEGGEPIPARIVLVASDRQNLTIPYKKPDGQWDVHREVVFFWSSPNLKDVRPLSDPLDLPDQHPLGMEIYHPDFLASLPAKAALAK
jgi:hypothetical protein